MTNDGSTKDLKYLSLEKSWRFCSVEHTSLKRFITGRSYFNANLSGLLRHVHPLQVGPGSRPGLRRRKDRRDPLSAVQLQEDAVPWAAAQEPEVAQPEVDRIPSDLFLRRLGCLHLQMLLQISQSWSKYTKGPFIFAPIKTFFKTLHQFVGFV